MTERPTRPITRLALFAAPLLLMAGCAGSYEHEEVTVNGQGMPTVHRVADEPPPVAPAPVQTGPTAKEVEQQSRINQLEAQQKALQAEIEKIKHDQAASPK